VCKRQVQSVQLLPSAQVASNSRDVSSRVPFTPARLFSTLRDLLNMVWLSRSTSYGEFASALGIRPRPIV